MARTAVLFVAFLALTAVAHAIVVREVSMKVLVLGTVPVDDATVGGIKGSLEARGMPWEYINVLDSLVNGGELPLVDQANSRGKYYAIVTMSRTLAYQAAPNSWPSALSTSQWAQLHQYMSDYSVRLLSMHSWPNFNGLDYDGAAAKGFTGFTSQIEALDAGLKPSARIETTGSYITPASSASVAAAPSMTLAANFFATAAITEGPTAAAAAIEQLVTGGECWHWFFIPTPYYAGQVQALTTSLQWLTRGIFLGRRRIDLSMQIDDLFMTTGEWETQWAGNDDQEVRDQVRTAPADIQQLVAAQDEISAMLPVGSSIRYEWAFNGEGVDENGGADTDPLTQSIRDTTDDFWFVTHTYNHPYMDDFSYAECREQFKKNKVTASEIWGSPLPDAYSPTEMVNPAITGLFNGNCLRAASDEGIITHVGDNSRSELLPDNPYHGIYTTVATHGFAGNFIIPRWATNIFFDNSHPSRNLDHFHYIQPQYASWTWEDLMEYEGSTAARNMLHYRPDGYMFHQGNAVKFPWNGADESLLSLWAKAVAEHLNKYNAFPVRSQREKDQRTRLEERMDRDKCGIDAYMTMEDGIPTTVHASTTGTCRLAVSGVTGSPADTYEDYGVLYGGERTVYKSMTPGKAVDIPTGLVALPSCPIVDGSVCAGHGTCMTTANPPVCVCNAGWTGTDCSVSSATWDANLLANAGFETVDPSNPNLASGWSTFFNGYTRVATAGAQEATAFARLHNGDGTAWSGASRYLYIGQQSPTTLRISGWSRHDGDANIGSQDANYAIYADLKLADGTWMYGITAQFSTAADTAGKWQYAEAIVTPTAPVEFMFVYAMFRNHQGTADFDSIAVQHQEPSTSALGEPTLDGRCGFNTPNNAACPSATPCCSVYGWCGSSDSHCSHFSTDDDIASDSNGSAGSSEPAEPGMCDGCIGGSSGPCKDANSVCSALLPDGTCSGGTTLCDDVVGFSSTDSYVVSVMTVEGITADAFSPELQDTYCDSVAQETGVQEQDCAVMYVADAPAKSAGTSAVDVEIVLVARESTPEDVAAKLDESVQSGSLDNTAANNHFGVHTSADRGTRIVTSPGVGGVGMAFVVGGVAAAVVLGVLVGALSQRKWSSRSSSAVSTTAVRAVGAAESDSWSRGPAAITVVSSARPESGLRSHLSNSLKKLKEGAAAATGNSAASKGYAPVSKHTSKRHSVQSAQSASDSDSDSMGAAAAPQARRVASQRQMLYKSKRAKPSHAQSFSNQFAEEPQLFGTVTPRQTHRLADV